MKDMRHENINLFLGFFHDCGVFAIVTEYCSRGSMEDLLVNDDVKLDWMFKSSLLLDLIKVEGGRAGEREGGGGGGREGGRRRERERAPFRSPPTRASAADSICTVCSSVCQYYY